MAFEDYLECRALNLSVEIFYNSGIFREIIEFLKLRGLSASEFIERVYSAARNPDSPLFDLFAGFLEENLANLWDSRADLAHFVADPGTVTKYIAGEHGNNELFKYRSLAFFRRQSDLHNVAFGVARDYLLEEDICDDLTAKYLDQLKRYSMLRKDSMLEVERAEKETFDFDFVSLERENFGVEPSEFARSKAVEIEFSHSPEQSELISTYIHQYGTDVVGLGRILIRSHVNKLYRQTGRVGEQSAAPRKLGTYDDQTAGVPATG